MSTAILDVPEITCGHCAATITAALGPQPGIRAVRVDVPAHQVHVEFDAREISLDRVKEVLADEEYPVRAVTIA